MDHIPDRDLIDEIDRRLHQRPGQGPLDQPERDVDGPTDDADGGVPEARVPAESEADADGDPRDE